MLNPGLPPVKVPFFPFLPKILFLSVFHQQVKKIPLGVQCGGLSVCLKQAAPWCCVQLPNPRLIPPSSAPRRPQ